MYTQADTHLSLRFSEAKKGVLVPVLQLCMRNGHGAAALLKQRKIGVTVSQLQIQALHLLLNRQT